MLRAIDRVDHRLTELENTFSNHMGEAARGAMRLVLIGLGATTVLLWTIGMVFASRLLRRQLALDRQLGLSERRFRDYADVASDWYWEADAGNRVTYLSERFYAATGISSDAVLGRPVVEFIRAHSDRGETQRFIAALSERRPFRGIRFKSTVADGSTGYWSLAGKPHVDAEGQFLGHRGIGADVTATVHDAQTLREAKTRAEEANRAKSEFLANMSHELRTPLNAILGFSEVIANRVFGREASDRYSVYAGDINRSGRHLLAIIDDILDLSKIEAGHADLFEAEITLDKVVAATRTLFGDRFEQAELTLRVVLPAPPVGILVDERKLTQALVNLLSNALKFTPPGGRVILAAGIDSAGNLTMSVSDTGIGIPPERIEVALSPFGQIESPFSRQHQGTGLGLSLAKSLMELHDGTLLIDSVVGVGTIVTLVLPASRVRGPAVTVAEPSAGG
jgi:PAS domain S-box-containing protein